MNLSRAQILARPQLEMDAIEVVVRGWVTRLARRLQRPGSTNQELTGPAPVHDFAGILRALAANQTGRISSSERGAELFVS